MEWVNQNIQYFNGDSSRVTVWGHRAGGTLVSALIGYKKATKYFSNAWISSGSVIFPTKSVQESEKNNSKFLDNIGCNDAFCLRNKKAEDIMKAVPHEWYGVNDGLPDNNEKKHNWLVNDHVIIKQHIGEVFRQEKLPVKLVMGTTAYSGSLPQIIKPNSNVTKEEVKKLLSQSLLGNNSKIVDDAMK